jgi:hypothetical protein
VDEDAGYFNKDGVSTSIHSRVKSESAVNGTKYRAQRGRHDLLFSLPTHTHIHAYTYILSAWLTLPGCCCCYWLIEKVERDRTRLLTQYQKPLVIFKSSHFALSWRWNAIQHHRVAVAAAAEPRRKKNSVYYCCCLRADNKRIHVARVASCRVVIITFTNDLQL